MALQIQWLARLRLGNRARHNYCVRPKFRLLLNRYSDYLKKIEQMATLTHPVGRIPYTWLNELNCLIDETHIDWTAKLPEHALASRNATRVRLNEASTLLDELQIRKSGYPSRA
jgi:hypothetical protein